MIRRTHLFALVIAIPICVILLAGIFWLVIEIRKADQFVDKSHVVDVDEDANKPVRSDPAPELAWEWLIRPKPTPPGIAAYVAVAVDRPITVEEALALGKRILRTTHPDGAKFAVFFDASYARREMAVTHNGLPRCANIYFYGGWDNADNVMGVGKSDPSNRLDDWLSSRYGEYIWNEQYEDGVLTLSMCGWQAEYEGGKKISSVPEIWTEITQGVLQPSWAKNLLVWFYDLKELKITVYDEVGGRLLATFYAPREALERGLIKGPIPDNVSLDYQNRYFAVGDQRNAGALTSSQYEDQVYQLAVELVAYYKDWFAYMAASGAQLDAPDSVSRAVPRGFRP